jgi:hypothetical protein
LRVIEIENQIRDKNYWGRAKTTAGVKPQQKTKVWMLRAQSCPWPSANATLDW